MAEKMRVLLADDQELVRSGFAMILSVEEDIELVGQVSDGQQAVDFVAKYRPDVVLMDVQMPVLNGIQATAHITSVAPDTKVLILTTFDREDYLFDALKAGASGFVLKTSNADDLVEAIRKVACGLGLLAPEMTLPIIKRLVHPDTEPVMTEPELSSGDRLMLESLTARERETLELLAEGLTNAEIANRLFLGAATVKTHVSNILAKTQSRDRVAAVIFAYRTGIAG